MRWSSLIVLLVACGDNGATRIDAAIVAVDAPVDAAIDAAIDAPAMPMLTLARSGTGQGTVSGTVACGAACTSITVALAMGTQVTLDALPTNGTGSYFAGWSGACAAAKVARRCTFTLTASTSVGMKFDPQPANLAFVSSTTQLGNLGSAAAYDAVCNNLATTAGINTATSDGYIAWISSSTTNARDRLGSARGWVLPDGRPFGDDLSTIFVGQIYNPITIDENGVDRAFSVAFTGTTQAGLNSDDTCTNWTSVTMTDGPTSGYVGGGPYTWSEGRFAVCGSLRRIYCLGNTRTTPVAVVPMTGKRIWFTAQVYVVGSVTPDAHCNANRPANVASARAVIATTTTTPASKLDATTHYVRPDGVEVGTGAQFASGRLVSGLWQDNAGSYLFAPVFAGGSWNAVGVNTCTNWTSTAGTTFVGNLSSIDLVGDWADATNNCSDMNTTLLCAEI